MKNELDLPEACQLDPNCIELANVWRSEKKFIAVIRYNFFEECGINEVVAWGQVLADTVDRVLVTDAKSESLSRVLDLVRRELDKPTTDREGEFA
jgi:hypothetical protein